MVIELINFATMSRRSSFSIRAQNAEQTLANKCREYEKYIEEIENLLKVHNIPLPEGISPVENGKSKDKPILMKDGTIDELRPLLDQIQKYHRKFRTFICYRDLGIWTMSPKSKIPTVGGALLKCLCGPGPLNRVDILKDLSGRILPGKLTLLLGPPGSGSSPIILR